MTIPYANRNPFETFLFVVSLIAAAPLLIGNSGSAVLEQSLPDVTVIAWGICLLAGTVTALAGQFWRAGWTGWVLERAGCILVGGGAAVYAVVILASAGGFSDVRYLVCVQFGYAAACLARALQLTRLMGRHRTLAETP